MWRDGPPVNRNKVLGNCEPQQSIFMDTPGKIYPSMTIGNKVQILQQHKRLLGTHRDLWHLVDITAPLPEALAVLHLGWARQKKTAMNWSPALKASLLTGLFCHHRFNNVFKTASSNNIEIQGWQLLTLYDNNEMTLMLKRANQSAWAPLCQETGTNTSQILYVTILPETGGAEGWLPQKFMVYCRQRHQVKESLSPASSYHVIISKSQSFKSRCFSYLSMHNLKHFVQYFL